MHEGTSGDLQVVQGHLQAIYFGEDWTSAVGNELAEEKAVCASWQTCRVHLDCLHSICALESSQEILTGAFAPVHEGLCTRTL